MVRLRLTRMGKRNRPFYRLAAMDIHAQRDGRAIEFLGTYDPFNDKQPVVIDRERTIYWLGKGAQPSDTVAVILRKQGIFTGKPSLRYSSARSITVSGLAQSRKGIDDWMRSSA